MALSARSALQPRGYGIWMYKSEDAVATVGGSNYFQAAYDILSIGDRILVTTVTNLGRSNEAYSDAAELVVTACTSASVTTTEA